MNKVLFISNNNPLSVSYGAEQRSHVILEAFLNCGYQVDIAYIGVEPATYSELPQGVSIAYWDEGSAWKVNKIDSILRILTLRMMPKCRKKSPIIKTIIRQHDYDYIFCRYIYTAAYSDLWPYRDRLLLDVDDMPDQAFATVVLNQKADLFHKFYHQMMKLRLKRETRKWIKGAHTCFLPNTKQAEIFHCTFLPNLPVVTCDSPKYSHNNHTLLFIGLLNYSPNYIGIADFLSNCWEDIIREVSDAKLVLAGKGLNEELKKNWSSFDGVKVLGFVEDIYDFYDMGNVFICPVTTGAGTNIKIAEAMTLGKACVVSSFSSRGYENIIVTGLNSYICNNWKEMAETIKLLLKDDTLCKSVCDKAFETAKLSFSSNSVRKIIKDVVAP